MKKTLLLKTMLLLCAIVFGTSAWATDYQKVTTLTSGKSYIVVSGGYAIKAQSSSSGWVDRVSVSENISEGVLTTTATNIVWVMTSSGTGDDQVWTFKNGNNWLLNTSGTTYRNMSVGTSTSATATNQFKISNNKIYSTGATSKYLNCCSDGFRMYASNQSGATVTFEFYEKVDEKVLSSLEISGTPTKTTYTEGETFDPTGLVVTGTYSDSSSDDLTASASFECTPNILSYGTTSVSVVATVSSISSSAYAVDVTVNEATKYTVTINTEEIVNGTLTIKNGEDVVPSGSKVIPGTTLTICATPDAGYRFKNWQYKSTGNWTTRQTNNQDYTMPASDVQFRANFDPIPQYTYSWMVNGTEVKSETLYEDDDVVFPPVADIGGKVFYGWVANSTVDPNEEPALVSTTGVKASENTTYYAVFATKTAGTYAEKTDEITRATTGVAAGATSYSTWSGKTVTTDAVYAGNSAGGGSSTAGDAIQIRTKNSDSGIVSTTSGGDIKKVTVVWSDGNYTGTTLNVYASTSAYTDASDLYSGTATVLGTIVKGTSTEFTITGDYQYVGIRSNNNAICLDKVSFTWGGGTPDTYSAYCTSITVPVTISDAGYATFSNASAVDFSSNTGLSVYYVSSTAGNKAEMVEIGSKKVPANTGVLLKGAAGNYSGAVTAGVDALVGNLLFACVDGYDATVDNEIYILANGTSGVGFYPIKGGTSLGAGKAYIGGGDVNAKCLTLSFGSETTAINGVEEVAPANVKTRKVVKNGRLVIETANGEFTIDGARVK